MINYINPEVVLIPNPVGVDAGIQKIQTRLGSLPWLQKVFGRSYEGREKQQGTNRDNVYPYVIQTDREPLNVLVNDNLQSYCFFIIGEPITFENWMPMQQIQSASYPISIVFWMNLEKIDPTKKYNFGEELKLAVLRILAREYAFSVERVFEKYDSLFKEYDLTETYKQYLLPPYYGFRVEGTLIADYVLPENC